MTNDVIGVWFIIATAAAVMIWGISWSRRDAEKGYQPTDSRRPKSGPPNRGSCAKPPGSFTESLLPKTAAEKPTVVTMGWAGWPRLLFPDGKIVFSKKAELALYKEYYPLQRLDEWPTDPVTRERLKREGGTK